MKLYGTPGWRGLAAATIGILLAACAAPSPATGSGAASPPGPPTPHHLAALPQFRLWLGEWRGAGWSISATGERVEFDLAESVREKVGGSVLQVEGHGTRTDKPGMGQVTHDGLVLVYRDAAGHCRWNGHEARSGAMDAEILLLSDGMQWSIKADAIGTTVRFSIHLDGSSWREYGEVSGDGERWSRFMEMTLSRVGT